MNQTVNALSVDDVAHSYTCSNRNITKIVLNTFVTAVFKLKLGQNVTIRIKIHLKVLSHPFFVKSIEESLQKWEILPSDFWSRCYGSIVLRALVETEWSEGSDTHR